MHRSTANGSSLRPCCARLLCRLSLTSHVRCALSIPRMTWKRCSSKTDTTPVCASLPGLIRIEGRMPRNPWKGFGASSLRQDRYPATNPGPLHRSYGGSICVSPPMIEPAPEKASSSCNPTCGFTPSISGLCQYGCIRGSRSGSKYAICTTSSLFAGSVEPQR